MSGNVIGPRVAIAGPIKMLGWILPQRESGLGKKLKDYAEYQSDLPRFGLPKAALAAIQFAQCEWGWQQVTRQ